jgi:hypothetical protein
VDDGERTTDGLPAQVTRQHDGGRAQVTAPGDVDVLVGLDVGKQEHFADVLDNDGERLFARAVANDRAGLEALLDRAARHGTPGLVIDQPGSITQLALAVAARRGTPVACVPGLVMRRAADLYPGEGETPAWTIKWTPHRITDPYRRRRRRQSHACRPSGGYARRLPTSPVTQRDSDFERPAPRRLSPRLIGA